MNESIPDLAAQLRAALGAYGEACLHHEHWTAVKAQAREAVMKAQQELEASKGDSPTAPSPAPTPTPSAS